MILTGDYRKLRIATFASLYFAQGIPIGLLDIAMPAWMAQVGFSNTQIAGFLAVVGLPWAFKLVAGPFMDRFTYPQMGKRRPWVMAAQGGLMLALILLTVIDDAATQLGLLTSIGFLVNCFGATQDVAVDGMAIDVVPFAERGRANAFMAFGQVTGFSVFGALCGVLLANYGLPTTALLCASVIALILVWITLTRERKSDQYLPSVGQPAAAIPTANSLTLPRLFKNLWQALTLRMSMLIILCIFLERVAGGMINVIGPLVAVKQLGFEAQDFSQTYGLLAGLAAGLGLLVGPLIDRVGAKSILFCAMSGGALLLFWFSLVPHLWDNLPWAIAAFALWLCFVQAVFVSSIALCMSICWAKIAATQFAVYMALSNLGRSMGAGLYAGMADHITYPQTMQIAAIVLFCSALALAAFNLDRQHNAIQILDAKTP